MNATRMIRISLRIALLCGTLFGGVAAEDTSFIGVDGTGDLANPDHWSNGRPTASDKAYFWGPRTVTASADVEADRCEVAASNGDNFWNLAPYRFKAQTFAFGATSVHDTHIFLNGGSLVAAGYNAVYVGMNGSSGNSLTLDNATLDSGGLVRLGSSNANDGTSGDGNLLLVGTNATFRTAAARDLYVGEGGDSNVAAFIGSKMVDFGRYVYCGYSAGACNNRFVMRDVEAASFGDNVYVGYSAGADGNSLLVSNVTAMALGSGTAFHIGYAGACSTGAIYMAEGATTLPCVRVGTTATATNCFCLVDGGGASFTTFSLTKHADLKAAGSSIELRNMTIETTNVQAIVATNLHWTLGPGATFRSTFAGWSPLPLYGADSGITVDGGNILFPNANGNILIGSRSYGDGMFFDVKNGGKVSISNDLRISADKCRIDVSSGGDLSVKNVIFGGSDTAFTISNATVKVSNQVQLRYEDSDFTGVATNNVLRFVGTRPCLEAESVRALVRVSGATDDDMVAPIFEFVVPERGYETVPMDGGSLIWLRTNRARLRVDASAYRGDRTWRTLMKARQIAVADFDSFVSGIPENCRARTVKGADGLVKEIQLQIHVPHGTCIVVR